MSLIVIERSSGAELARNLDDAAAIEKALSRGGQPDDLVYIHGDVDIRIFSAAKSMEALCGWFPRWLRQKDAPLADIQNAEAKYTIWTRISKSREVAHACEYAASLASIFGQSLADDLLFIVDMVESLDWEAFAPDTYKHKCKACVTGRYLAVKKRYSRVVLAHHEQLGIYVVCPSEMISKRPAFVFKIAFSSVQL